MSLAVPLSVRLSSSKTDIHVTRDLRSLSFGNAAPGGYSTLTMDLDRPLSLDPAELAQYVTVRVYDTRSGEVVWYGRLEDPGRGASGDGEVWSVTAVGPAAHALDGTVPLIYVDRSFERWSLPGSSNHKNFHTETTEHDPGTGDEPSIRIYAETGAAIGTGSTGLGEIVYKAIRRCGQYIARARFLDIEGLTDANWLIEAGMALGAGAVTVEGSRSASTVAGGVGVELGSEWTVATDYDVARFRFNRNTSATTGADTTWTMLYEIIIRSVLMTAAGVNIATGYTANTVKTHEIVKDLLGRLLTKFDGANASISEASTYAIEQLAFPDGVTPMDVLAELMLYEPTYFWQAWEDRLTADKAYFEWKAWPSTIRYEADTRDGFDSPGSAQDLYDAVTVRWRDSGGRIRTNTRTQTVQALTDAGLTRTAFLDLGDESASSGNADRAGDQFLAEHASAPNAGTLTIKRPILDLISGRMVDPFAIKSGELIRVRDVLPRVDGLNATARDAVTVFRVVGAEYDAMEHAATLDLDSKPRRMSQIIGRNRPTRRR